MKKYRGYVVALPVLLLTLPLFSCSNPLEGGSDPSGSVIRVQTIAPDSASPDARTPDIYVDICDSGDPEPGIHNYYLDVAMRNESRPNSPADKPTNSYVTMSRYQVDFIGLNLSVSIPPIVGAGQSVGIPANGTGTMKVLVLDFNTIAYIIQNYPAIGVSESLDLRVRITIWGVDAFGTEVRTQAEDTLVVDNYDRCGA